MQKTKLFWPQKPAHDKQHPVLKGSDDITLAMT